MCRAPIKNRTPNRMVEWPADITNEERDMLQAFTVNDQTNQISSIVEISIQSVLQKMSRFAEVQRSGNRIEDLLEAWSDLESAAERMDEQINMITRHVRDYISANNRAVHNFIVHNLVRFIRSHPESSYMLRDCRESEIIDALRIEPNMIFDAIPEEIMNHNLCSIAVSHGVPLWKIPERFRSHSTALTAIVNDPKNIPFMPVASLDELRVMRWMNSSPTEEDIARLGDKELIAMYNVHPAVFTIIPRERWENLQRENEQKGNIGPGRVWGGDI